MLELCPNCHQPIIYHIPSCSAHKSAEVVVRPRMPKDRQTNETYAASDSPVPVREVALDVLLAHTAEVCRVDPEEVIGPRKQRQEAIFARRIFISCAIDVFGYSQRELSAFLRCSIATVDKGITVARRMLRNSGRDVLALHKDVLALARENH